ncbi:MAG TPA: hypothetical protein VGB08_01785 [Allosphingosinicella sp.]|jgi:hypothetical protein
MKSLLKLCTCAAALAVSASLAACGEQRDAGGLSAEENEKLNKAAETLDANDIVDASPDSLVAGNDEWGAAENGEADAATGNVGAGPNAANGQ